MLIPDFMGPHRRIYRAILDQRSSRSHTAEREQPFELPDMRFGLLLPPPPPNLSTSTMLGDTVLDGERRLDGPRHELQEIMSTQSTEAA